jgi:predicted RNase H-like HicB family nuclease
LNLRFRARIEQDEDSMFVVECPTLPGCISQGATRAEALANLRDAIEGYLASLEKHGDPVPPPISEEIIEVSSKYVSSLFSTLLSKRESLDKWFALSYSLQVRSCRLVPLVPTAGREIPLFGCGKANFSDASASHGLRAPGASYAP